MSGATSAAAGRRHRLLLGAALFLVVAQILVPELTYNSSQRRQAVERDDGGWLPSFGFGDNHTSLLGRDDAVEEVAALDKVVAVDPSQPPTLFICRSDDGNGMAEFRAVFKSILSDYVVKDLSGVKRPIHIVNTPSNTYDVLIGVSGNLGCHAFVHQWILTDYRGHIAVYSPESDRQSSDKTRYHKQLHYFGPALAPVRETDMVVTYFQTTWWTYFREVLPTEAMVNATLRPQYRGLEGNATSSSSKYMIYAQNNCVEFRDVAAWQFSKHGAVRCGGQCCGKALDGNTTNLHRERVGSLGSWRDNVGVYAQYKFCLVMEHERAHESYVTEKLLMAFIGGCIPIYHGPPELIFDVINPRAFVFYNVSHPESALALVEALHTNDTLYRQMQQEPIVARGEDTIEKYFSFADDVGGGALKRRIRRVLGIPRFNRTNAT